MLCGTKALVRKLGTIITTDRTLPFLGAALVIAFILKRGLPWSSRSLLWAALPQ
jgi:hypothetical protein